MPKLTLVLERKPVRVFDVNSSVVNIGRAEDMQLMIDNASVSRRQAQIRFGANGSWTIQDLGSVNGTFLNGRRLTSVQPLKRGDEVSFGKVSLFFDSAITEPVAPAGTAEPPAGSSLTETVYMSAEEAALFGIDKLNVVRSELPSITHVDYSARIQTVHAETNPPYHALLSAFKRRTGCPVLVNTSFNVRGEPIVCTPEDAFRCFMGTEMETLVIGDCILAKDEQDPALAQDYKHEFELD